MGTQRTIDCYFLILPGFLPLDLAGPLQVLLTANNHRQLYNIHYLGVEPAPAMKGGLSLQNLQRLPELLPASSRLIIPGLSGTADFMQTKLGNKTIDWLQQQRQVTALELATVCSGSLLAASSLWLKNRHCTTHHDLLARLQLLEPSADIATNRLYVQDHNVWTSAGISSGIDMFLAMLQQDSDPAYAAQVAREMVIYLRRSGDDPQLSPWLCGRNHMQQRIHKVQDLISQSPQTNFSIDALAVAVNMSARNLTRAFRQACGQSVAQYREKIKVAQAQKLLKETDNSIERVAQACGFQSSRSFRRVWNRYHSNSPVSYRGAAMQNLSAGHRLD